MWGDFSSHLLGDSQGDTLPEFLDNFEPILNALDLDTAFTHQVLSKGYAAFDLSFSDLNKFGFLHPMCIPVHYEYCPLVYL